MLISYKRGQASVILRVKILDSSVSTGAGKTGLTEATSGLIIGTIADNEAATTRYRASSSEVETIGTLGTFAAPTSGKCRFKEVDSTNHPGVYEIQLADARFAVSSAKSLLVSISGAADAAQCDAVIPLTDVDPYDAADFGMTALAALAVPTYQAKVIWIDDDGASTDRYLVCFFKNGELQTSGITLPTITVIAESGSTQIATVALDAIGASGYYKFDASSGRLTSGAGYVATVGWTQDAATHAWAQPVGRPSA